MLLKLQVLTDRFAVCKADPKTELPAQPTSSPFLCVTRTSAELSIICPEQCVPEGMRSDKGWRAIKFDGQFELDLVGVLNSVTTILAKAEVSILAISTYDTDYVLVKEAQLEKALSALRGAGHIVE